MTTDELNTMLRNQHLITFYLKRKIEVVNYIKNGYDMDEPILVNNSFLHFTAHVYYRSLPIDLYALLGPANSNNKSSFRHITNQPPSDLNPVFFEEINELLRSVESEIVIIKELRHTQFAHYDFSKRDTISFNFNELATINQLFLVSVQIIRKLGDAFVDQEKTLHFDLARENDYIKSLSRLIDKAK